MRNQLKEPGPTTSFEDVIFQRLEQQRFDIEPCESRGKALLWYRRFWEVKRKFPAESLLVSKDIDLIWHEHLRSPSQYEKDCCLFFGGLLPHIENSGDGRDLLQGSEKLWLAAIGTVPNLSIVCKASSIRTKLNPRGRTL
jgi:hypothetical protein